MILFPNAKINLGLHVVSRRDDGYHNIETVFYPVPLCDALEVVKADSFDLQTFGLPIDGESENNLVVKATKALQEIAPYNPAFNLFLKKNIPLGSGLGGGSSDAAFALKLINSFMQLGLTNDQLKPIAAKIGADCAFFIENKPVFATGIGDIFTPIQLTLKGYHIVIIKPDIFVSTKDAYSKVQSAPSSRPLSEVLAMPIEAWKDYLFNDFEASVFQLHPEIASIKEKLYALGALYASMSGSGSSVFGLFDHPVELNKNFTDHYSWQGILQ